MKENLPLWKSALNASLDSFGLIPAGFSPSVTSKGNTPSVASQSSSPSLTAQNASPISPLKRLDSIDDDYTVGDEGEIVLEINIRLAGFGGMLPTEKFTELTKNGVEQFQKDYMKMEVPIGKVDHNTLKAIDEFSEKYREDVNSYKCVCGSCSGFGKGQYKNQYKSTSKIESNHKYEYPGMHQSLLWAVSASRFYLTQKLNNEYSIKSVYSAYRCWEDNTKHNRSTTNHMGKAVDLHFNKNNKRTHDMDILREKIYCECIGAPKQGGNSKYKFGWLPNKFGLEPNKWADGGNAANTWIHFDVREFDKDMYLKDDFFIKFNNESNFNKNLTEIAKGV